jgi:arylsulfatase A-like enzyme
MVVDQSSRCIPIPLNRRDGFMALALMTLVISAGTCQMVVGVCGVYHDDAVYVSTAKALAQGDGYRLINVPGSPVQSRYPILYPAVLALVWRLWPTFPENLLAMQGLSLLAGGAAVGLAYLYLVRFGYCSRRIAVGSGLLCGTCSALLYFSTQTLSEMPFALLLLLALWALDRDLHTPTTSRLRQVFLGVLLGVPFMCRSIGVALIPVGLLLLYRAGRPVRLVVGGLAAVTLPWVLWTMVGGVQDPVEGYHTDYFGWWGSFGLPLLGRVFLSNVLLVASSSASIGLEGIGHALLSVESSRIPLVLLMLLGAVPWLVMLPQLRAGRVLPCFLMGYLVIILFWPWPPYRFLIPILPILVPFLLRGIWAMSRRFFPLRRYGVVGAVALGIAVTANLALLYRHCELNQRTRYPYGTFPDAPVSWSSYERVFDWLRTHARPDDVVASGLDSMIYLYTDLRGFRPFVGRSTSLFYGDELPPLGTVDDLVHILLEHEPRYLVRSPMLEFSEEQPFDSLLAEMRDKHPGWLAPVYQSEDQQFVIFELQAEMQPAGNSSKTTRSILQNESSPNVVLISVDTLRPDHLGCYGYTRNTSPRIDRLAAEGTLFENAISSTSWTLPAHAALMTGLPDSVHGCLDTDKRLSDSRTTLAERLKAVGYATVGFFSGPYLHPVFGLSQGFEKYVDCTSYPQLNEKTAKGTGTLEGMAIWQASHRDVTNPRVYKAVHAWLTQNRERPFFMFVHLWDVHFDFIPPEPYDQMFDPDYQGSFNGENFLFDSRINARMPKRDLEHLIALYDGEIAWTDMHVGKILDDLDALGLRDTTMVVLVADHGTEFFEHGEKGHRQTLFEEAIRIPLIMRYPGRIPPGQRVTTQTSIIDVLPTIMELVGLSASADVMGRSLVPLFLDGSLAGDNPAISELYSAGRRLRSFRRSGRKLIRDEVTDRAWVYNLLEDPGELSPVQDIHSSLVQAATGDARLGEKWLAEYQNTILPGPAATSHIPPALLEKLRSLGYVGSGSENAR